MDKVLSTVDLEEVLTSPAFGEVLETLFLRKKAWENFQKLALPARSVEAWKYIPAENFLNQETFELLHGICPGTAEIEIPQVIEDFDPVIIDVYSGAPEVISPAPFKLPTGLRASRTFREINSNDRFRAQAFNPAGSADKLDYLIDSLFTDGVVLRFDKAYENVSPIGVYAPIPSHQAKFSKSFVFVGADSSAEIILWIDGGAEKAQLFKWLTAQVQENAHLSITVIQVADSSSKLLVRFKGSVHQDGSLVVNFINLGGGLVRNEITAEILGRGAEAGLFGMTLADGTQRFDIHTYQSHQSPKGASRLRFKQVFMGESFGVFDGIIQVPSTSAGSDAYQENHNLLLSQKAKVYSIPRLEINTDDVRCTHGATVRHVLPHEVFYLRSRGLRESVAKHLLVASFLEEMTKKIPAEKIKLWVETFLRRKIESGIV